MKQAVVLIHGIGEQVPMDTLRGFAEAVWTTDSSTRNAFAVPSQVWSKPDRISGDFELRRLTTAENREDRRTDFFEFYWAHMMEGTEVMHLAAWARLLLWRSPARVPEQLRGIWYFLIAATAIVLLAIAAFYFWADSIPGWVKTLLSLVGAAAWAFVGGFVLKKVAGDAARYLHVAPPNIESRRRIREAGVKLLKTLHRSGSYDRIIVAGHSLGSVIGYDILTHYWASCHDKVGARANQRVEKLGRLERLARDPEPGSDFARRYQAAQSEYLEELQAAKHPWLVTDFITMGSPLAHAVLLLGRNEKEFQDKKNEREFPSCPPVLEEITIAPKRKIRKFTFRVGASKVWIPHHAAVFAPTRWTNLYFPCRATLWGDVIGGPLVPVFGPGILDIPVTTHLRKGLFTHTCYWRLPEPAAGNLTQEWIEDLRKAMRICMTPPPQPKSKKNQANSPEAAEEETSTKGTT